MKKWIIIGASSAMAMATARLLAARGASLGLLARDRARLDISASDLLARGAARVEVAEWDAGADPVSNDVLQRMIDRLDGVDGVLIAHGTLTDQTKAQQDMEYALREIRINALSTVSLCSHMGNYFELKRSGTLVVISSVAGDRGRQSNYVYGSAKAMVSTFLAGLRNRLSQSNVHVMTVKPGFVDSPMTAHLAKGPLWASPDDVAISIIRGIDSRKDVLYTPWFWRYIMLIIQHVPEIVFKRLKL
jgi:decaprenylphospho-beta-D-erythro-pentofuranosid-2-ulose 2-reductase